MSAPPAGDRFLGFPMSSATFRLAAALLVATALVLAPGGIGTAFPGPPIGETARWCLVVLLVLAVGIGVIPPSRRIPWSMVGVLVVLVGAVVWTGRTEAVRGWQVRYELLDPPPATATFAWRFRARDFRIDPAIDFEGTSFGLHFLNDVARYGHRYHKQFPRDTELPWRATWQGVAALATTEPLTVFVRARGKVRVRIGGYEVFSADGPEVATSIVTPPAPPGPLPFEVVYEKPPDTVPLIGVRFVGATAGAVDVGPFGAPAGSPPNAGRIATSTVPVMLGLGLLLTCVVLAYAAPPASGAMGWLDLAARFGVVAAFGRLVFLEASHLVPLFHTTAYMWAGDDPLVYVSNARSILLDGWLMPGGSPLGQGRPFYFYPFFGYVMGLAHWLIGEDFSVIQLVNGWCLALVLPLVFALGWRQRRWWEILAGTAAMYWLIQRHMLPYAQTGFTDSLFTGLVFATLVACRKALAPSTPWALAAGVLCSLAAAARPSFLTFTPLFVVGLLTLPPPAVPRWRVAGLIMIGFVAGMLPFALRNVIVSGQFVVLVSSWIQLPYFLIPPEVSPNPVPGLFGDHNPSLLESLATVFSLLRENPLGILALEARKLAFTAGFTQVGPPGATPHPEFLLFSALFVVVLALRRLPADLRFVLAVFAVSHTVAMVLAAPWTYGYKSILPLQAVFLFAAFHLMPAPTRAADARSTVDPPRP